VNENTTYKLTLSRITDTPQPVIEVESTYMLIELSRIIDNHNTFSLEKKEADIKKLSHIIDTQQPLSTTYPAPFYILFHTTS